MNENEIFVDIEGYEGKYQVSNLGRVKSLNYHREKKEKILKLRKDKDGYFYVFLYKNGKGKTYKVHKLVAITFIENPNKLPIINHKNEIKDDNKVDNLEWCTIKYNNNYNNGQKRRAEKRYKKVYQYTKDLKLIKIWESIKECECNDFNSSHITNCCRGKRKTHKGFIWSYQEIKKGEEN